MNLIDLAYKERNLKENLSKKSRHLIQVVGRRTGISSDVIRAWERRYKAIVSQRTETNRRLYTDDDIEKLTLLGRELGFSVEVVPVYSFSEGEMPVRSSEARKELSKGNIKSLNAMLGRRFRLSGAVGSGNHMGTELGFPTANISVDLNLAIPPDGIYATWVTIDNEPANQRWMGATSIGKRPTFKEFHDLAIETYLLDFHEDIYNRQMKIEFVQKIRDQKQFSSKNSLIEQMQIDIDTIRNILSEQK